MRAAVMGLLASLLGCASARVEPIGVSELEARLASATRHAPGVVFGAAWRDGTVVVRAAGQADLGTHRPALDETAFAWFSITKLFTATAVLQLVERGAVELDAPVSRYLPERRLERGGREATVRDLLAHSAGLANPIPVTWIHLRGEPGPSLDALVDREVGAAPKLASVPGTRSAYSNLGFLLLGQLVARVSGEPFEEYVRRHLLDPLGCESSGFQSPASAATGYQRRWSPMGLAASWMLDERFFGPTVDGYRTLRPFAVDGNPYGGLVGSVRDLLRFAQMILDGGRGAHGRVLGEEAVAAMLSPSRGADGRDLGAGLGWQLGHEGGEDFAYHLGGGGGFRSELRVYPRLGYAVAVLANETSFPTETLTRLVVR